MLERRGDILLGSFIRMHYLATFYFPKHDLVVKHRIETPKIYTGDGDWEEVEFKHDLIFREDSYLIDLYQMRPFSIETDPVKAKQENWFFQGKEQGISDELRQTVIKSNNGHILEKLGK